MKKRIYGAKINFKSLSCAPTNELGVVYLFGVLHSAFDFKIESIQAGYPDCIARREIGKGRFEEIRIEFEFESKNFLVHKHDPDKIDVIICWRHNWGNCPKRIEVIELSAILNKVEEISEEIEKKPKKISEYNKFCQDLRFQGFSFQEIADEWKRKKSNKL
ncbi:MAG: hypothetical protein ACOZAR_03260 [Patescibacteria group bacterium]